MYKVIDTEINKKGIVEKAVAYVDDRKVMTIVRKCQEYEIESIDVAVNGKLLDIMNEIFTIYNHRLLGQLLRDDLALIESESSHVYNNIHDLKEHMYELQECASIKATRSNHKKTLIDLAQETKKDGKNRVVISDFVISENLGLRIARESNHLLNVISLGNIYNGGYSKVEFDKPLREMIQHIIEHMRQGDLWMMYLYGKGVFVLKDNKYVQVINAHLLSVKTSSLIYDRLPVVKVKDDHEHLSDTKYLKVVQKEGYKEIFKSPVYTSSSFCHLNRNQEGIIDITDTIDYVVSNIDDIIKSRTFDVFDFLDDEIIERFDEFNFEFNFDEIIISKKDGLINLFINPNITQYTNGNTKTRTKFYIQSSDHLYYYRKYRDEFNNWLYSNIGSNPKDISSYLIEQFLDNPALMNGVGSLGYLFIDGDSIQLKRDETQTNSSKVRMKAHYLNIVISKIISIYSSTHGCVEITVDLNSNNKPHSVNLIYDNKINKVIPLDYIL